VEDLKMGFHKRLLIDQQERERLLKHQRAPKQEKSRGANKMAAANDLQEQTNLKLEAEVLRTKGESCE
jgi:hypothetical protein